MVGGAVGVSVLGVRDEAGVLVGDTDGVKISTVVDVDGRLWAFKRIEIDNRPPTTTIEINTVSNFIEKSLFLFIL